MTDVSVHATDICDVYHRSQSSATKVVCMKPDHCSKMLQESAVANIKSLDELLRWVGKRSGARGVAGQVKPLTGAPYYLFQGGFFLSRSI